MDIAFGLSTSFGRSTCLSYQIELSIQMAFDSQLEVAFMADLTVVKSLSLSHQAPGTSNDFQTFLVFSLNILFSFAFALSPLEIFYFLEEG
jgi:hypothetical protein